MAVKGKVYKYGNNIDTDVIYPARYNLLTEVPEIASHCMEDLDRNFIKTVEQGDIVVAGYNFGCGSCREHAIIAIKNSGVSCVIAKSFARVFYRSSLNYGMAIIECPEAAEEIANGDIVEADYTTGVIKDITTGKTWQAEPFPEFIQKIIKANGLINLTKEQYGI